MGVVKEPLCKNCGESDPEKFQWVKERRREKAYREKSMCKKCRNVARGIRTPETKRNNALRSLYGITLEQYHHWLLVIQHGKCPGCGRTIEEAKASDGRAWPVDHDHVTGQVRGVLCHDCNKALGFARDSEEVLLGLAKYLRGGE